MARHATTPSGQDLDFTGSGQPRKCLGDCGERQTAEILETPKVLATAFDALPVRPGIGSKVPGDISSGASVERSGKSAPGRGRHVDRWRDWS
jgi:hypothetical protein